MKDSDYEYYFNPRRYLEIEEQARIAANAPNFEDLRFMLGLDVERFCKLIEIDEVTYMKWKCGEAAPSVEQKVLFQRIFDIAKKKGLLLR